MAKLQTLKQNTDPNDARDDFSNATKFSSAHRHRSDESNRHASSTSNILPPPSTPEARGADILGHISERHNSYR